MKAAVAIKGLADLEKKLATLAEEKVANQIVSQAFRDGAKIILAAAIAKTPEDTGSLKKSMKVRAGKRKKGRVMFRVGETPYKGDTYYGAMVEYGHGIGKRPKGMRRKSNAVADNRRKVKAHPFMRPAVDETKSAVQDLIAEQIAQGIQRVLK